MTHHELNLQADGMGMHKLREDSLSHTAAVFPLEHSPVAVTVRLCGLSRDVFRSLVHVVKEGFDL